MREECFPFPFIFYSMKRMERIRSVGKEYWTLLEQRAQNSRVSRHHQLVGLNLALILQDMRHKSLYIKLAKIYDPDRLLGLAKEIAEKKAVMNRGAYFMRIVERMTQKQKHAS